ncbi:hypothetical protein ACFPTO_08360 [Paraburkholderia denitrificans]|uniref:DUF4148 domain-containing protein n=1 Tax=Paraburkholderia denitrificans TaxID=694025 RepID=A0ABW0J6X7_9BURK
MKTWIKLAAISLVGITSLSAHAEHLTPQQCNGYPFVHNHKPTHDDLQLELALVEGEGYTPGDDDNDYPAGIQHAEELLQSDYARDCLHQTPGSST